MRQRITSCSVLVAAFLTSGVALAQPGVGASVGLGQGLGHEADSRVAATVYGYGHIDGAWTLGGELAGSSGSYPGGYGCGLVPDPVPAVPATCSQPTVAAHMVWGWYFAPTRTTRLRSELGIGATWVRLEPGFEVESQDRIHTSGLLRFIYLFDVSDVVPGKWYLGVQLEERALARDGDLQLAGALGLVFEARMN